MILFAFALVVAAAEPPPPPPLLDDPAFDAAPAPEAPPVGDAPPVLKPAPRRAPVPDEAPAPSTKSLLPSDEGLDAFTIGMLQWLLPCGTAIVAVPCLIFASYCPVVLCIPCLLPAANGYLATYVGDRFGKERAPAIWPVLAAYAAAMVGSVAIGAVYVYSVTGAIGGDAQLFFGALGVGFLVAAGASLAIPVSYSLTAEPKRAGDDGSDVPGWFTPAHPAKKKLPREPPDAPPTLTAMRF